MRLALSCTADIWCGWATADSILLAAADIQQVGCPERAERREKARKLEACSGSDQIAPEDVDV
jgi:hypothetical protein